LCTDMKKEKILRDDKTEGPQTMGKKILKKETKKNTVGECSFSCFPRSYWR